MSPAAPVDASEQDSDDRDVYVRATLTFSDDSHIELRQVLLGISPAVYIEPIQDENEISFNITSCDLDQEGLAEVLELCAKHVRNAEATS